MVEPHTDRNLIRFIRRHWFITSIVIALILATVIAFHFRGGSHHFIIIYLLVRYCLGPLSLLAVTPAACASPLTPTASAPRASGQP